MNMMYEKRREELWKYAGDNIISNKQDESDSEGVKVKYVQIDYFSPIKPSESPVSGFKKVQETTYNRKVYTAWVDEQFKSMFLLKGKKSFKKKYLDLKPYQEYVVSSLQMYLEQALTENTKYMLISWQEYNMLDSGELK